MQNNTKDRLINLIQNAVDGCARNWAEIIADHLLENGVIVPPCKVGDVVYAVKGCFYLPYGYLIKPIELIKAEVIAIKETKTRKILLLKPLLDDCFYTRQSNRWFPFTAFGKTVFATREEAERALKESEVKTDE